MENISDQALQAFLRSKIDLFEKHERGLGFGDANIRTRVQAAKDFVTFVFGGQTTRLSVSCLPGMAWPRIGSIVNGPQATLPRGTMPVSRGGHL